MVFGIKMKKKFITIFIWNFSFKDPQTFINQSSTFTLWKSYFWFQNMKKKNLCDFYSEILNRWLTSLRLFFLSLSGFFNIFAFPIIKKKSFFPMFSIFEKSVFNQNDPTMTESFAMSKWRMWAMSRIEKTRTHCEWWWLTDRQTTSQTNPSSFFHSSFFLSISHSLSI